jgi:hypothetical protein
VRKKWQEDLPKERSTSMDKLPDLADVNLKKARARSMDILFLTIRRI